MQQLELRRLDNLDVIERSKTPKVSIIIPAKNEEKNLEATVERTVKSMLDSEMDFEILIIDDGSCDNTLHVVRKLTVKDSKVVVLRNHSNCGKGLSLKKGFHRAGNEVIVMMDADGQHMPEEIPRLIWPILNGEADFVLGSRFLDKSNGTPMRHLLGNKVASFCFNLLYGSSFTDVLLGFRAFRRDALDLSRLESNGYSIEVEMLRSAMKERVKMTEVPTCCLYLKKSPVFRGIKIVIQIVARMFYLKLTSK